MFRNKPHLLTKYLLENNAMDSKFMDKLIGNLPLMMESNEPHFLTINDMNDYYNRFAEYNPEISGEKSVEEIEKELNRRLNDAIENERYEEASKIRDYMKKNNYRKF